MKSIPSISNFQLLNSTVVKRSIKKKFLLFIPIVFILISCKNESKPINISEEVAINTTISGPVFGTAFKVIYDSEVNFGRDIDSLFTVLNQSMSTYIPESDISRINKQEPVNIDNHFKNVLQSSKTIYESTQGIFDPTIGAVVNAWDFGPEGKIVGLDSLKINELMQGVGFDEIALSDTPFHVPEGTFLDFNAIAKGYAVDVIADFLELKSCHNYLVEIGGEIRSKGINKEKGSAWRVGIDEPRFDGEQSVLKAITLGDVGMATSGTYRKFKTDDNGNRFAHIIDTKTGYPSKTNILSVSVMAKDCMTADAYATAFQAMGVEKVKSFLKDNPDLRAYLIFENDQQELETLSLNGFPTD